MKRIIILAALVLCSVIGSFAEPVESGWWTQTASSAGDIDNVAMEIKSTTPHIITLESNNGWLGYAWYNQEEDIYTGFFELTIKKMDDSINNWAEEVFHFTLSYDGLTLTMKAESNVDDFNATFWKKSN